MARVLLQASRDAADVSAGLEIFDQNIPSRDTDLRGCINELLDLSDVLREIAQDHPNYDMINPRLTTDVEFCVRSIELTLRKVRTMFGQTSELSYGRAWTNLETHLYQQERGPPLYSRLRTYNLFMSIILDNLRGPDREYVDTAAIVANRKRISAILQRQEPLDASFEAAFAGMTFDERPRWAPPPRPPSRPQFSNVRNTTFTATNISPTWSDESDNGFFPPAPDPPLDPLSPTMSNTSNGTWTSNSSATRAPISHWALKVFDAKYPRTPLLLPGEPIQCFGRAENPMILHKLVQETFIEVVRLQLDGVNFYVRLFCRPSDHRARILCTRKDGANIITHYCIPLTALKLTRKGSTLILWRLDRTNNEFNMWAHLTFQFYEPLVLFYCTFTALKSQDLSGYPDILRDKYHQRNSEEKEEWAGEIKDDDFLHALRIYRDKDTRCIRLEARARRGAFILVPIWTAFVTRGMLRPNWYKVTGVKTVQLSELHPYVFCPDYTPPKSKSGKFKLQFTSSKDATNFIHVIDALAVQQ